MECCRLEWLYINHVHNHSPFPSCLNVCWCHSLIPRHLWKRLYMDMCQVTYQLNYFSQQVESNKVEVSIPPLRVVLTGGVGKMNGGTLLWWRQVILLNLVPTPVCYWYASHITPSPPVPNTAITKSFDHILVLLEAQCKENYSIWAHAASLKLNV